MLRAKQNCMANILLMPAKCLGAGGEFFALFALFPLLKHFFKRATAAAADEIIAKMPQCPMILILFR